MFKMTQAWRVWNAAVVVESYYAAVVAEPPPSPRRAELNEPSEAQWRLARARHELLNELNLGPWDYDAPQWGVLEL